jgi:6-phosphogluconolactonase/glucosamine-6-phosphate isomerase/deaminase
MIDYIYTDRPVDQAADAVVSIIKQHLEQNQHVLWLLTGGSGINVAIKASKKLRHLNLTNLAVSLTDERYGAIGHENENWQQMIDAGLDLPRAELYRPLIGKNLSETTLRFNDWIKKQFTLSDYKIAIFGIGVDGHIAGIKPGSDSSDSNEMVAFTTSEDFTRMSITFSAIKQLDEAVVQVSGTEKQSTIHNLISSDLLPINQPAQILKSISQVTLYTNIKEKLK